MCHLRSVEITNFCISDTPVFLNQLIRLEPVDIRAFSSETSQCHFFIDRQNGPIPWVDEKISGHAGKILRDHLVEMAVLPNPPNADFKKQALRIFTYRLKDFQ